MRYYRYVGSLSAAIALSLSSGVHALNQIPYGTPTLDGSLSANEWSSQSRVRVARFYGTDQFSDFYLQWDDKNLYIAGMMEDYTLKEEGSDALYKNWDDDSVELFIHPSITDNATKLGKISRILGFTPTGKSQRLDRGKDDGTTTSLETFRNTTNIIGEKPFFNAAIPTDWVCSVEQPTPITYENVVIQYKNGANANSWWFEMALPWALVGTREGQKITGANCGLGAGIFPAPLAVKDGTALKLNFKRINDDNGGTQNPVASGTFTNDDNVQSTNGTLFDEWAVYQGDTTKPAEWETFVLRKAATTASAAPTFSSTSVVTRITEGRRAVLTFVAPSHGLVSSLPASRYSIRYQAGSVDAASAWDSMTVFNNAYLPAAPGTTQSVEIIGLTPSKTYTVGIRAVDEAGRESSQTLSTSVTTSSDTSTFVTNNPTGRSLVTTDGQPFLLLGETVLMPWLPVRGLYDGDLCDEVPPTDTTFTALTANRTCTYTAEDGTTQNGRLRNYAKEKLFYTCVFANGKTQDVTDIEVTDILTSAGGDGAVDNCNFVATQAGTTVSSIIAKEGAQIAVDYMAKLKAAGINVISVFVESLDLHGTPIMFQQADGSINPSVLSFLDQLMDLAKQNDVRVMMRLYDTYYYKKKWAQTYWAKALAKASYDGFFDADIYAQHKARLDAVFNRVNSVNGVAYKDDPTIFGWDLLNEVDNKERFNTASITSRRNWLQTMAAYTREKAPHQQVFFSFLTWDPKDDGYYRKTLTDAGFDNFLGMDADLAFRLPGATMSAVHGYYAHIANPQAIPATGAVSGEFQRPLEMARGLTYNYYQVRDGRSIQDTEGAPSPLFIKNYSEALKGGEAAFSKADDKEMFLNSAWLHFVSGGAGANMRWPITLDSTTTTITQLDSDWRALLTVMKNTVGSISWRGDRMNLDNHRINAAQYIFNRHDNSTAVAYFFNPNKASVSNITLPGMPQAAATVKVVDPRTGTSVAQSVANVQSFTLNTPINDHAVIIATGTFGSADDTLVSEGTSTLSTPVSNLIVTGTGALKVKIGAIAVGADYFTVTFDIHPSTLVFTLDATALAPTNDRYSKPALLGGDLSVTLPQVGMPDGSVLNNVVLNYRTGLEWTLGSIGN